MFKNQKQEVLHSINKTQEHLNNYRKLRKEIENLSHKAILIQADKGHIEKLSEQMQQCDFMIRIGQQQIKHDNERLQDYQKAEEDLPQHIFNYQQAQDELIKKKNLLDAIEHNYINLKEKVADLKQLEVRLIFQIDKQRLIENLQYLISKFESIISAKTFIQQANQGNGYLFNLNEKIEEINELDSTEINIKEVLKKCFKHLKALKITKVSERFFQKTENIDNLLPGLEHSLKNIDETIRNEFSIGSSII